MKKKQLHHIVILLGLLSATMVQAEPARNPVIWADVPDVAVIRVGDTYYMSSTTMHMSPGLPIMKSKNIVNWDMISYAYDRLVELEPDLSGIKEGGFVDFDYYRVSDRISVE